MLRYHDIAKVLIKTFNKKKVLLSTDDECLIGKIKLKYFESKRQMKRTIS